MVYKIGQTIISKLDNDEFSLRKFKPYKVVGDLPVFIHPTKFINANKNHVLIRCDDNKTRRVNLSDFYSVKEWRRERLNKLNLK